MDMGPPGAAFMSAKDSIVTATSSGMLCRSRRSTYALKGGLPLLHTPLVDVPSDPTCRVALQPDEPIALRLDVRAVVEVDDRQVLGGDVHDLDVVRLALLLVERAIGFVGEPVDLRVLVAHVVATALLARLVARNLVRVEAHRHRPRVDARAGSVERDIEVAALDDPVRGPLTDEGRGGHVLDLHIHADLLPACLDKRGDVVAQLVSGNAADRDRELAASLLAYTVRAGSPPGLIQESLRRVLVVLRGRDVGRCPTDRVLGARDLRLAKEHHVDELLLVDA